MRPIIERLNKKSINSFIIQKDVYPYFPTPWHFHPEYELVLVLKSTGRKIIGDHISNFKEGDLAFLGPYLPHVYENDEIYHRSNSSLLAEAIVIHFTDDFPVKNFFDIPEMINIRKFLDESSRGFTILGQTRQLIEKKMNSLLTMEGPSKIIELIAILDILAHTDEKKYLASPGYIQNLKITGTDRINKVCEFIIKNFTSNITLDDVSNVANMSPNAFCHFFKARTRKTFINFINEIRIGYACKLIIENRFNISEICYKSGFQNLSNFNRQFKKIMKKTPREYRNEMLKNR